MQTEIPYVQTLTTNMSPAWVLKLIQLATEFRISGITYKLSVFSPESRRASSSMKGKEVGRVMSLI